LAGAGAVFGRSRRAPPCIDNSGLPRYDCFQLATVNPALPVLLTVADLESLPDDGNRYEIVDGELFVSTSPSFVHQTILARLLYAILNFLQGNPIGDVVPGVGVIFDDHNAVIPDLVYISRERMPETVVGGRLVRAPEIAIEILSPGSSNERRDRHIKLNLYSARAVREYWIVDPESRSIDIYRNQSGKLDLISTLHAGDVLTSTELPGFSTRIESLFPKL
jgi:Uma2 family endonuclease